ncbi:hypothetical protein [Leptospira ilyithenensis]|uniref:hypothetical protein n=1 Tax=Leptospira ilyithenensis TaxID=2484901 RepID=UPI001FE70A01|nr:hypothetical protein [Leptospira ilyithenensis]
MVRCPVCSHRFQFNPNDEKEIPGSFEEETIPSFQFQPSNGEYMHLIKDLLYAPIDFLKSKFGRKTYQEENVFWKNPKFWIPILLFGILGLYLVRNLSWKDSQPLSNPHRGLQEEETDPNTNPMGEDPPRPPQEEEIKPPSFEI